MTESLKLEVIELLPIGKAKTPPLLFVHGAWHGSWCWAEYFLPYFAKQGYHVKALSLRGHGASEGGEYLRWTRISAYVKDVLQVARTFPNPPILIGHSMGGLVVQKFLESCSNTVFPKAILLASVPPWGVWKVALGIIRRHPLAFLKAILTLKLYPIIGTKDLMKEAFFSENEPEENLERYFSKMQNESFVAFLDMLFLNLPHPKKVKTSIMVLGAEKDTVITRQETEYTAKAYGTEAKIFKNIAHDMMLDQGWKDVADYILRNIEAK